MEKFYEFHANDQRISKFERIIYKLNKLLNSEFDQQRNNDVSNIYNLNNTNNVMNNSGYSLSFDFWLIFYQTMLSVISI